MDLIKSVVGKSVAETVVEATETDDVVLERNIRPASAAPSAEASASKASPSNTTPARCPWLLAYQCQPDVGAFV